ncbi:hypothetical protein THAR02_04341 [Trichoderma harzianum]|uniref:Uncharacterized protein n=1 Tax=Trichoderma harzianum TaxID=5544 RepID=A0A0G0AES6_TRIHA|nr:hypothetical protein THAR02_04341 [Trichoderma harzianum]
MIENHGNDSDNEVLDENVGNALIDGDEYIPFEGEEEDDDDEDIGIAALVNATESDPVAQSNNETTWDIFESQQWVEQYDKSHPVDEDDEDLHEFEVKFSRFIEHITQWAAASREAGWYKLPRGDREMTLGFHSLIQRAAANPAALVWIFLDGMPRKVRQVLDKEDLSEIDFLDLPAIPSVCKHRLVYVDVAPCLHQGQIKREVRNRGYGHKTFKISMPACDLKEALEAKLYLKKKLEQQTSYTLSYQSTTI